MRLSVDLVSVAGLLIRRIGGFRRTGQGLVSDDRGTSTTRSCDKVGDAARKVYFRNILISHGNRRPIYQ